MTSLNISLISPSKHILIELLLLLNLFHIFISKPFHYNIWGMKNKTIYYIKVKYKSNARQKRVLVYDNKYTRDNNIESKNRTKRKYGSIYVSYLQCCMLWLDETSKSKNIGFCWQIETVIYCFQFSFHVFHHLFPFFDLDTNQNNKYNFALTKGFNYISQ